jgi:hypothetical protein
MQFAEYKERLGTKEVGRSFSDFQEMKYSNPDRWAELKTMYRQTGSLDNSGGSGIIKDNRQCNRESS